MPVLLILYAKDIGDFFRGYLVLYTDAYYCTDRDLMYDEIYVVSICSNLNEPIGDIQ